MRVYKKQKKQGRCGTANASLGGAMRRKRLIINMDSTGDLMSPHIRPNMGTQVLDFEADENPSNEIITNLIIKPSESQPESLFSNR